MKSALGAAQTPSLRSIWRCWSAAAGKLLRTDKVRADPTVLAADVVYPTASSLLGQAAGTIFRPVVRIDAAGATT